MADEPTPDEAEAPTPFDIRRFDSSSPNRLKLDDRVADHVIRPCDHRKFVADEKWRTVVCDACGAAVDPFAVILVMVKEREWQTSKVWLAQDAEAKAVAASIRQALKRVCFTPEERKEWGQPALWAGAHSLAKLRDIQKIVDQRVRDAKRSTREAKRQRKAKGLAHD